MSSYNVSPDKKVVTQSKKHTTVDTSGTFLVLLIFFEIYLETTMEETVIAINAACVETSKLFNQVPNPGITRTRVWAQRC